ncbi:MAG: hypothetical protein U0R65_02115 [Candidatus Nanopelagicales bacterium]
MTLVAAGQCTKVDPAAPPQVAGLLGCGVMAGLGAAINTGNVSRGDTVAVIGCGGVGDACRRRPAGRGAHDRRRRHRRPQAEIATQFEATHTVNSREVTTRSRRSARRRADSAPTS